MNPIRSKRFFAVVLACTSVLSVGALTWTDSAVSRLGHRNKARSDVATIYSENFAGGNSTFTSYNVYVTALMGGSHPSDPLYPEIVQAEGVTVGVGEGPSGQNVMKWNGTWGDYQTSGIYVSVPHTNMVGGRITFKQKFVTEMLEEAFYMPLTWISMGALSPDITFGFYLKNAAARAAPPRLGYLDITYIGSDPRSAELDFSAYENQWVSIEICWALGPSSRVRVKFNGVTLWDTTLNGAGNPLDMYTSGDASGNIPGNAHTGTWIDMIGIGSDGLAGPITNIVLSDLGCDASLILIHNTEDSCCMNDDVTTGGPGNPGDVLPVDPFNPALPVELACTGGGVVPVAGNPSFSENWLG